MIRIYAKFEVDPRPYLEGLKKGMANSILRKACRRAGKQLKQFVKQALPSFTGSAKRALANKVITKHGEVMGVVGPKKAWKKNGVAPVRYMHLIETGRKPVKVVNKKHLFGHGKWYGTSVAGFAGKHYLAHTFASHAKACTETLINVIKEEIPKYLAKQAAKGA